MLQPKTHFEQVPLEVVMKIVAEQLWQREIDETGVRDSFQQRRVTPAGKSFGGIPPQTMRVREDIGMTDKALELDAFKTMRMRSAKLSELVRGGNV